MKAEYGKGTSKYGPGVNIELTGGEVATAIIAYLVAHDIYITGPRTVTVNRDLCEGGNVYVDPSGYAVMNGVVVRGNNTVDFMPWTGQHDRGEINTGQE